MVTLIFTTSEEMYAKLNVGVGVCNGEFDMETGQHRYQAFHHTV
ncbi:MAG: hypothetical protein ACE5G1_08030 [bacterium]